MTIGNIQVQNIKKENLWCILKQAQTDGLTALEAAYIAHNKYFTYPMRLTYGEIPEFPPWIEEFYKKLESEYEHSLELTKRRFGDGKYFDPIKVYHWDTVKKAFRCIGLGYTPDLLTFEQTQSQDKDQAYILNEIDEADPKHKSMDFAIARSDLARQAANARHDKPGGSREKQDEIKRIWASGKYSTRDICAEKECAALKMSFSSARKALRNTPDPAKT